MKLDQITNKAEMSEQSKQSYPEPNPDPKQLSELAIWLEGLKKGQGNLYPLGTIHLENLWITIKYLQKETNF